MKRVQTLLFIAMLCALVPGATLQQAMAKEELSTRDKAAIVQAAMELRLKSEGPLKFSEYLIFSSAGMSPSTLPKIASFQFELMKASEIKKRRQKPEGFRYLMVDFAKSGEVVSFNLYVVATSGGLALYSHVYKYVFSKVGGEWQGKLYLVIC